MGFISAILKQKKAYHLPGISDMREQIQGATEGTLKQRMDKERRSQRQDKQMYGDKPRLFRLSRKKIGV